MDADIWARRIADLDRKVDEAIQSVANLECDVPQEVFVIEECSELTKELTKARRGKGDQNHTVEEACDVITSVLILLRKMYVSDYDIRNSIISKCERAVNRFLENGQF